jgi:hypothetical protein
MPGLRYLCGGLLLSVSSACAAVVVEEPIGMTPLQIDADEWEGNWEGHVSGEEDAIVGTIEVLDVSSGILRAVWIENGEPHSTRIYLLEAGDWMFASVPAAGPDLPYGPDSQEAADVEYVWARFERAGDAVFAWEPDVGKFRELVESGLLPGRAEEGRFSDVLLGTLDMDHYAFLASEEAGIPFEWDGGLVLVRSR